MACRVNACVFSIKMTLTLGNPSRDDLLKQLAGYENLVRELELERMVLLGRLEESEAASAPRHRENTRPQPQDHPMSYTEASIRQQTVSLQEEIHKAQIHITNLEKENGVLRGRLDYQESLARGLQFDVNSLQVAVGARDALITKLMGEMHEIRRETQILKQDNIRRNALLKLHDVIAGVKSGCEPLKKAFDVLNRKFGERTEVEPGVMEAAVADQAPILGTTPDVIVALWSLNQQRHQMSHDIVRGVGGMESLLTTAKTVVDDLSEDEREAARFVIRLYTVVVEKRKNKGATASDPDGVDVVTGSGLPTEGWRRSNPDLTEQETSGEKSPSSWASAWSTRSATDAAGCGWGQRPSYPPSPGSPHGLGRPVPSGHRTWDHSV
jgi:hypothetical protein